MTQPMDPVAHAIAQAEQSTQNFQQHQPQQPQQHYQQQPTGQPNFTAPAGNMPGAQPQQPYQEVHTPQQQQYAPQPEVQHQQQYAPPAAYTPPAAPATANATPGRRIGFSSAAAASTSIDGTYIGMDGTGFQARYLDGDNRKGTLQNQVFDEYTGMLDTSAIKFYMAVRYNPPGKSNAEYIKSPDGVRSESGEDWPAVVSRCQSLDPKCRGAYPAADVTVELTQPVTSLRGQRLYEEGERLIFSTSVTNFKNIENFVQEMVNAGVVTHDFTQDRLSGTVLVHVKHEVRTKPNVKPWGVTKITPVLNNEQEEVPAAKGKKAK